MTVRGRIGRCGTKGKWTANRPAAPVLRRAGEEEGGAGMEGQTGRSIGDRLRKGKFGVGGLDGVAVP